jgi:hypothetical protein
VAQVTQAKNGGRAAPRAAQWRKKAAPPWSSPRSACREMGHHIFYEDEATKAQVERAVSVCGGCIVRQDCLESAMAEEKGGGSRYGIRGGVAPKGRKALQTARTLAETRARKKAEQQEREAAA